MLASSKYETLEDIEHDYVFVDTKKKFKEMLDELKDKDLISFDLETGSLDMHTTDICGIALSVEENKGYYVPVFDPLDDGEVEEEQAMLFGPEKKKDDGKIRREGPRAHNDQKPYGLQKVQLFVHHSPPSPRAALTLL